ncbi:MAG: cytochrome c oxidase assembly factor Coa1 family protein [Rhodanobacteraceae bacterium]
MAAIVVENTSGRGAETAVPAELNRWNWGAFLLNWIWGIGNNTPIALLALVPFAGIVMLFVLGVKGNEWAWQNKRWDSVEHFRRAQRAWAKWGVIAYVVVIVVCVVPFLIIVPALISAFRDSDAYRLGAAAVQHNAQAIEMLGTPMNTGFPSGSINESGPSGTAKLSFAVDGAKGNGTVYLDAVKDLGRWRIERAELAVDGSGKRIELKGPSDTR